MRKIYQHLQPYKFRLMVFFLLSSATLLSLALFRMRVALSGSLDYAFLVWNIFLAWIPFGLAHLASAFAWKRKYLLLTMPVFATLWLLFFPNAPYILTDLLHLHYPKHGVPLWFDALMLLWFAWTGLLLGLVSLLMMQEIVRRAFGRIAGWLFVGAVGVLCSLGIYIGRFLRWNSWDMIFSPLARLSEFLYYASRPSMQSIVFIAIFAVFFLFIYVSVYAFGLLLHEQAQQSQKETQ